MSQYEALPAKPPRGGQWDQWGDAVHEIITEMAPDLANALTKLAQINANGGGGGGRDPFVAPTSATTWPKQDRTIPGRLMWLRHWNASTLAPIPKAADGYKEGDLVFPVLSTESLVTPPTAGTVILSDTFEAASPVDIDARTADPFGGGVAPSWVVAKSVDGVPGTDGSHAACHPSFGMDLYTAMVYTSAPAIVGDTRLTVEMNKLDVNNQWRYHLRGSSPTATDTTYIKFENKAGTVEVSGVDRANGSETVKTVGSFPATFPVNLTIDDAKGAATVKAGSVTCAPFTLPTSSPRLGRLVIGTGYYSTVRLRRLTLGAI